MTFTGRHSYTIKYTYNIGKDPLKIVDELYYNLIGDQWDTSISNVTFKITMPKSFDKSLLGFSSGYAGLTTNSNVTYSVDGNTISGSLASTLSAGEALTVRLTLPEGYFIGESTNLDPYSTIVISLCVIFVFTACVLWAKYGKDEDVIETVEFYPPDGYNSAEVGFLYEGEADTKSVISLLVYLADKGYLKIEKIDEKEEKNSLFLKSKNSFRITKLKEYDGDNENEKVFFNGLFKERDISGTKSVTASDLYDNFYTTLGEIKDNLNSEENKSKIFESSATRKEKWIILMIAIIFILVIIQAFVNGGEIEGGYVGGLIMILVGAIVAGAFIGANKGRILYLLLGVVFSLSLCSIVWIVPENTYALVDSVAVISISVLTFFLKIMPKRTPYGNEMLGKLRGFRRFLETAEKPQLESLVKQNPEYFYNILPYTYALGVSDVWISQFETIALKAPMWYDGADNFNIHTFETFMTTTMASAMSSSTSSDSGGSSGGGSSGGGSGGGGGGSW